MLVHQQLLRVCISGSLLKWHMYEIQMLGCDIYCDTLIPNSSSYTECVYGYGSLI